VARVPAVGRLPVVARVPAVARLPAVAPPGAPARSPSRACHLRHRQVRRPVTYAIDMPYRCRWRSRQVPFGVDGVADSLRSGQGLRPRSQASTHRPHRYHAQHAGRTHGSSWILRVAESPQRHTLTSAAGKRGLQRHTSDRLQSFPALPPGRATSCRALVDHVPDHPAHGEEQPAQPRKTPALAPPPRTQGGERARRQPDRRYQLKRPNARSNHPSRLPSPAGQRCSQNRRGLHGGSQAA
jgi:hypothetical protein